VHDWILSPFLTKYYELFNHFGHPAVKNRRELFLLIENSPATADMAVNHVFVAAVLLSLLYPYDQSGTKAIRTP
jgi:hypothetical protein